MNHGSSASSRVHLSPLAGRGRIALAIRVRGSLRKRGRDCFKNCRHVAKHVVIPEPQNSVVVVRKPLVANCIAGVVRVLSSIRFNNEASFAADKIDNVGTDRLLPNELVSVKGERPKPIPQSSLSLSGGLSQASGPLRFDLVSCSQAETPPHPARFARRPLPARGERLTPRTTT
jgi:hypothetical protein